MGGRIRAQIMKVYNILKELMLHPLLFRIGHLQVLVKTLSVLTIFLAVEATLTINRAWFSSIFVWSGLNLVVISVKRLMSKTITLDIQASPLLPPKGKDGSTP